MTSNLKLCKIIVPFSGKRDSNLSVFLQKLTIIITITAYMHGIYQTKRAASTKQRYWGSVKYGADLALLGLFIFAVLFARLITASKSAVKLTGPISLTPAGLSVSMPTGNGWQSGKQWKYYENSFVLEGLFAPDAENVTTRAQCRYLLAAPPAAPDVRLKQKAADLGGEIVTSDQTRTDSLTIDWAHIKIPQTPLEIFFGTAQLPNNRQLDIEVRQNTADAQLAEIVFKRIAGSLKFKDNPLLSSGAEIVTNIKSAGLGRLLYNRNQQAFFLIKDAAKRVIGFTMDVLVDSASDAQLNIQAASFFYVRGWFDKEEAILFQSDNSFNQFEWNSETSDITGRVGTRMALGTDGLMTVKKSNRGGPEKICRLGPAAIPELLLEFLFSQMLDSGQEKIMVDIIEADGIITPAIISIMTQSNKPSAATPDLSGTDAEPAAHDEEQAEYVFKLVLLDDSGFSEQIYLDRNRHVFKRLLARPVAKKGIWETLHQKDIYILERTSLDNILKQFPQRASRIMQNSKIFEPNQP